DGTLRVWDFESATLLDILSAQDEFLFAGALSSDGRLFAVGGGGKKLGDNKYDAGTDHDIRILRMPAEAAETATGGGWGNSWLLGAAAGGTLLVIAVAVVVVRRRRLALQQAASVAPSTNGQSDTANPFLNFPCSVCNKPLKAKARLAGKKVKCPHCGA